MHLEILVEEVSAEAALYNLVPRILGSRITFAVHAFQGKSDLLAKLPSRLKEYSAWLPNDYLVVILMDRDSLACTQVKRQLERIAAQSGLITKTAAPIGQPFHVLNRLCIEELEAWFFGDVQAIATAYPGVPLGLASRARFRDPDAITGGTWESLERVLQQAGHHRNGLEKTKAAREISQHMDPQRNSSKSFRVFRDGLIRSCYGRVPARVLGST